MIKTCYKHIVKFNLTCVLQSSDDLTLLGAMIEKNSTFKKHIDDLVHKARKNFMLYGIIKAKILGNAFIDSQFNYAPLIWMFCRKSFYYKIEKKSP